MIELLGYKDFKEELESSEILILGDEYNVWYFIEEVTKSKTYVSLMHREFEGSEYDVKEYSNKELYELYKEHYKYRNFALYSKNYLYKIKGENYNG